MFNRFERAAKQDCVRSQSKLAFLYWTGCYSTRKNYKESVYW
jgi:TPR repeat protein